MIFLHQQANCKIPRCFAVCARNKVGTILCLDIYLSPKASSKFGRRVGPLPLPLLVLAERLWPKPGGMSGPPGASRAPTSPWLANFCMSTPHVVLGACISPHKDVLPSKNKQWSAFLLSKPVTRFSNSPMLVALPRLVHTCCFGQLDSTVQAKMHRWHRQACTCVRSISDCATGPKSC